jgi:hypothetical protein
MEVNFEEYQSEYCAAKWAKFKLQLIRSAYKLSNSAVLGSWVRAPPFPLPLF